MHEYNIELQKAGLNFKIWSELSPARTELHIALTTINYTDTECHTEKYPVHKWHFWACTFFQISLFFLIVKGIILL